MKEKENNCPLKTEEITKCPECGSKCLICDYGKAEIYCADCGMVIDEKIVDLGPEWRAFDPGQAAAKARTGAPMTYRIHDKGLSTVISSGSGRSSGEYKLQKWQRRTHIVSTTERSFIFALSEIDRMASALKLPVNIREAASILYREAMDKRLIRGRSIEGITTALLYITCRQYGVSRTLEEMRDVSRVGEKEISRARKFLIRDLDLKVSPASPVDYIPRFCSELGLNDSIRQKAIEITIKAEEAELTNGRGPIGIAAAAIYIAAIAGGVWRKQREISKITGVTEVTIRNRCREL